MQVAHRSMCASVTASSGPGGLHARLPWPASVKSVNHRSRCISKPAATDARICLAEGVASARKPPGKSLNNHLHRSITFAGHFGRNTSSNRIFIILSVIYAPSWSASIYGFATYVGLQWTQWEEAGVVTAEE